MFQTGNKLGRKFRRGEPSPNPGGRPKRKLLTDELERLLEQEAPNANGKTCAAAIGETLVKQARKGNVRAIVEIGDRVEGKTRQPVELGGELSVHNQVAQRLREAREARAARERMKENEDH